MMDTRYDYAGFIPLSKVRNTRIMLAGCGAVGCNVMLAALQTGYRKFTLVDYDTIGLHNCARSAGLFHPVRDLGKQKTAVLERYALDWDGECDVKSVDTDIRICGREFFDGCDIVVCALDNYEAVDWMGKCMAESGIPLYRAATSEWNSSVEIVRNAKTGACLCCNHERKPDIRVESCGVRQLADEENGKTPALEVSSAISANRLVLAMTQDLCDARLEDVRYYDTGTELYKFRLSRSVKCSCHDSTGKDSKENTGTLTMVERRLLDEEAAMLSLNVPGFVEVKGRGERPYREYEISVKGESRLKSGATGSEHVFRIIAPPKYPVSDAPVVSMKSPPVAHINCFKNGNICIGHFTPAETLASVALRTIRVVLLDPATFNYVSKADSESESHCRSLSKKWEAPFPLPVPKWENLR
jgi:molybdopterin/thiamine biosynthesis adenylyltransferase/ubiquitin-protein ligase